MLLTLEPPSKLPTIEEYRKESVAFLKSKGIAVLRQDGAKVVASGVGGDTERATVRIQEGQGNPIWMDYYRVRRPLGGTSIAARLPENDPDLSRREIERIAASIRIAISPTAK